MLSSFDRSSGAYGENPIAFKLPKMAEYNSWQRLLNTADSDQTVADFASGADLEAPPRSVLAFAGSA